MKRCRRQATGALVAVLAAGCGGAQQASPPPAPAGAVEQRQQPDAETEEAYPGAGGMKSVPGGQPQQRRERVDSTAPQSRYAQPPDQEMHEHGLDEDGVMRLLDDFTVAESFALSGQGGCENACRALRSMIRSADRICAIAENDAEQRICRESRRRVRDARDFVRSSCGRCVHGPDLEN